MKVTEINRQRFQEAIKHSVNLDQHEDPVFYSSKTTIPSTRREAQDNTSAQSQMPIGSLIQSEYQSFKDKTQSKDTTIHYGWNVKNSMQNSKLKSALHYSTEKNLQFTQENTKRRLKQSLLQSTKTPFVFRNPSNQSKNQEEFVRVEECRPSLSQETIRFKKQFADGFFDNNKLKLNQCDNYNNNFQTVLNMTSSFDLLKFNLPYSLAPLPSHLDESMPEVASRPQIIKRKDVHSYFRPTMPDFVREFSKQGLRNKLSYKPFSTQEVKEERGVIPDHALFSVLDTQHIEMKQWKEEQIKTIRKTTFSNAVRFAPIKLNYTQECSDRSLIDADPKNKNKARQWSKATQRKFLFLDKEQIEIVENKIKEKQQLRSNLAFARQRAEDEIQQRLIQQLATNGLSEPPSMEHNITYKEEEHQKVKAIKPYVKQIVQEIRSHVYDVNRTPSPRALQL